MRQTDLLNESWILSTFFLLVYNILSWNYLVLESELWRPIFQTKVDWDYLIVSIIYDLLAKILRLD